MTIGCNFDGAQLRHKIQGAYFVSFVAPAEFFEVPSRRAIAIDRSYRGLQDVFVISQELLTKVSNADGREGHQRRCPTRQLGVHLGTDLFGIAS